MNKKILEQDIIDRLLVAKDFLGKIRSLPIANPDRYTIARHILTAHDAAELAIAAVAHHLRIKTKDHFYLMNYFSPISKKEHPDEDVMGKTYFSQLNIARNGIKHKGVFPDPKQWVRTGENTYNYVSIWCKKYLYISFDELDESNMISDPDLKQQYDIAKKTFDKGNYKETLEKLGLALNSLFENDKVSRNLSVGIPRAEDALKLSAFGVHANEFLTLQEFLPRLKRHKEINWKQEKFGHPANWRKDVAGFCLKTFVSVALRIQDAKWLPFAVEFDSVYEHKITALVDNVEIVGSEKYSYPLKPPKVVHTLKKGESLCGKVTEDTESFLVDVMLGQQSKPLLHFENHEERIGGDIERDKISVTCVLKNNALVRKFFSHLKEIEYE